jgi:hypothetical protein
MDLRATLKDQPLDGRNSSMVLGLNWSLHWKALFIGLKSEILDGLPLN